MSLEIEKKLLLTLCEDIKNDDYITRTLWDNTLDAEEQLNQLESVMKKLGTSFTHMLKVGSEYNSIEDDRTIMQILNNYESFIRHSIIDMLRKLGADEEYLDDVMDRLGMSSLTHDSSYSVAFNTNVFDLDGMVTGQVIDIYKVGKVIDEEKDIIQIGDKKYQGQNNNFFDNIFLK